MSRIIQLKAENVKRLSAVSITPQGNLVVVGGRNAQGKSSVLDSIAMALGGKEEVPAVPVRRGQERASVVVDLGDLIVKRTFTAAGGTNLVVTNKDKMKAQSPQAMLDRLTGKLTFDPVAFARLGGKEQAAALKKLVGLDFSAMDAERAKLYAERTVVNREVDRIKTVLGTMPMHSGVPEAFVDEAALLQQLQAANEANAKSVELAGKCGQGRMGAEAASERVQRANAERARAVAALERANKEVEEANAVWRAKAGEYDAAVAAQGAFVPVDTSAVKARLLGVKETNAKVAANQRRLDTVKVLEERQAQAERLTNALDGIEVTKERLLKETKFPVPGLGFDENGVTFNGVPFSQASGAETLRVSVAIAAAMNPGLRVMLVRDGSLLDDNGLALLAELAERYDLQIWIERVGVGAECSVIIEDGAVAGATAVATTEEDY